RRSAESYGPRLYGAPCAGRFSNLSRSPVRQERESLQGIPEPLRRIANVAAKRLRASRVAVHSPIGASEKTAVLHEDHLARAELDPIAVKNDAKPEALQLIGLLPEVFLERHSRCVDAEPTAIQHGLRIHLLIDDPRNELHVPLRLHGPADHPKRACELAPMREQRRDDRVVRAA